MMEALTMALVRPKGTGSGRMTLEPGYRVLIWELLSLGTPVAIIGKIVVAVVLRAAPWLSPIESIVRFVLQPLRERHTVDVFVVLDAPPSRGVLVPGISVPLLMHALELLKPAAAVLGDEASDEAAWRHARSMPFGKLGEAQALGRDTACGRLNARVDALLGGIEADDPQKTGKGPSHFLQARKLQTCWAMIEAYEQRQRQNYSHVMRLRPDLLFKQPLNLASYYSTARAPATAAFRPTMDGGPVPEPHQSTQSDTVAAEHDSKREDGLCVRQELSEPGKRDAAPGRTAGHR